jgi:hypothetical protein
VQRHVTPRDFGPWKSICSDTTCRSVIRILTFMISSRQDLVPKARKWIGLTEYICSRDSHTGFVNIVM